MRHLRIGLDIGSTTLKAIAIDEDKRPLFTYYERHNADVPGRMADCFSQIRKALGEDVQYSICLTGSVAMGVAERALVMAPELIEQIKNLFKKTFNPNDSIL